MEDGCTSTEVRSLFLFLFPDAFSLFFFLPFASSPSRRFFSLPSAFGAFAALLPELRYCSEDLKLADSITADGTSSHLFLTSFPRISSVADRLLFSSTRSQMAKRPLRPRNLLLPFPSLPPPILRPFTQPPSASLPHSLNHHLFLSLLPTPLPKPNPPHPLPPQRQHRKLPSLPSPPSLRFPPLPRTKRLRQTRRKQHRLRLTRLNLPSAASKVRSRQPRSEVERCAFQRVEGVEEGV